MRRLSAGQTGLIATGLAAVTVSAFAMFPPSSFPLSDLPITWVAAAPPDPPSAATHAPRRVLVQIFRGRPHQAAPEVEVATIFRDPAFALLADTQETVGSQQALRDRVRDLFELDEVNTIGSSLLSLPGGAALMDDGGRPVEVRVRGRQVGERSMRLVITASLDGTGPVTTSVIARQGRTVLLAGQPSGGMISFVGVTPL
ncbi:MAG: hypothetical protein ACREAA_12805 [Candidatus Polarisedimenticolia bacterium]